MYRTTSSYDRFWEGRKCWGGINNAARNLVRQVRVHEQPQLIITGLVNVLAAGAYALMHRLRGNNSDMSEYANLLTNEQALYVEKAVNKPLAIAVLTSAWVKEHCKTLSNEMQKQAEVYMAQIV